MNTDLFPFATRPLGMAIAGQTSFGKSSLLYHLATQDIEDRISCCVVDPFGDLSDKLLTFASRYASDRTIFLEVNEQMPWGINLFEISSTSVIAEDSVIDGIIQIFRRFTTGGNTKQMFPDMEYTIRNIARLLIANNCTMTEIPLLFANKSFRKKLLSNVTNPAVHTFWQSYEEDLSRYHQRELISSTINKVDMFLSSPFMYRVVGQTKTTIPFKEILSEDGKLLVIKLPIGELGEGNTAFLGSVLLSLLTNLIYERSKLPPSKRKRLHLYIDEYSRMATPKTTALLRAGQNWNIGTTVAFQTLSSLEDQETRDAIFQVGTLVSFQVIGGIDAELFAKQFPIKPTPTERKLQIKTEPVYDERDEQEWIENGEAQYQQALAEYEAAYETEHRRLTVLLQELRDEEEKRLVSLRMSREVQSTPLPPSLAPEFVFYPAWCWTNKLDDNGRTITKSAKRGWAFEGWTDEKVEKTIGELVEVKEEHREDSFAFACPPGFLSGWREIWVEYTYLVREERYLLSEETLSALQFHLGQDKGLEARVEMRDFWIVLNKFVKTVYAQGIWFFPDLKPFPIEMLGSHTDSMFFVPPPDHVRHEWGNGNPTREVKKMMTNYPLLTYYPQPQTGEKRSVKGWFHYGSWRLPDLPDAMKFLEHWQEVFRERTQLRELLVARQQEQITDIHRQLYELEEKDQERRRQIKAQYQKTVHRQKYVGERAVTEVKLRIATSQSSSYSVRPNYGRWGPDLIDTSSSGTSVTESQYETNLYEWVDGTLRTYADMRHELEVKLASLPRFTCLIQSIDREGKVQERELQMSPPQEIEPDEEAFEQIRNRSLQEYGRPWNEIEQEIRNRQYIPPPDEPDGQTKGAKKPKPLPPGRGKPLQLSP